MKPKVAQGLFCFLVIVTLLTPFWVFKDLLFPFITSKAYYLRILVEITLPFYTYLVLINKNYRPNFKNPLTISVAVFLVFNIISAAFGQNALRSFWGNFERMGGVFYLAHLTLLYFYVLLLGQISRRYLRWFLEAVIWIAAVITVDGLFVKLTHNQFLLNDPSYPRVSGTFGNPIFLASFLIIPMFLTAYYLIAEERRWLQAIYACVALAELYLILLSQTRGAVVGIAAALFLAAVCYVVLTKQKKVRLWGGIATAVFILAVVLAFTQHAKFPQGSMLHRVFNLKDSNTEARLIQWKVALSGYKDHPVLGVGPEDYYVISNAYYNPAIYQYDPSWFDKPHNYLIEVLVTTGALGFAAYMAIFLACVWLLYQAYKKELLSLLEFCLLLSGFLAYEIQNLTVFDTISASLMFFAFLGFAGFLWSEHRQEIRKPKKMENAISPALSGVIAGVTGLIIIYTLYVGNILGMRIATNINYGYAYSSADPARAHDYFETARNLPFDFDPVQFSAKYSDFAIGLASSPGTQTPQFVRGVFEDAFNVQQDAINQVSTDPTAWQELSNLYLTKSILEKTPLDAKAIDAVKTAEKLAPKRPEPQLQMARLQLSGNDSPGAEKTLQQVLNDIPKDQPVRFELGLIYNYSGKVVEGAAFAQEALTAGFQPSAPGQIDWLGQYYGEQKDWQHAEAIYQLAVKIDPNDFDDYLNLAKVYYELGDKNQAIALAQAVMKADPSRGAQTQALINLFK